ncbi:hypothetical protein [Brevifollis gellanilyticus]|uniref:Uncharacterized protein n=1 Tax=Brevifollis gellanilyticus TaxID=748831 RepID=A0A512M589_9BACT|nr:hypothetical protein [Brevifollis gellanilyticus]GEP41897.1 hypothetical protein BGE01nite_11880 [Brevifollis gellanilyticus]
MELLYPSQGKVSIWIGSFESEEAFDECVEREISSRLGHAVEISEICKVSFEFEPKPVEVLLDGFSGCESFISSAAAVAASHGVVSANAAIVCYHLEFRNAPQTWSDLLFLGSMDGADLVE